MSRTYDAMILVRHESGVSVERVLSGLVAATVDEAALSVGDEAIAMGYDAPSYAWSRDEMASLLPDLTLGSFTGQCLIVMEDS